MNIKAYNRFEKTYKNLSRITQNKIDKQILLLLKDFRHPSLHTKKVKGTNEIWETRIDLYYRMTFEIIDDTIFLRVVGNHDEVLKNP